MLQNEMDSLTLVQILENAERELFDIETCDTMEQKRIFSMRFVSKLIAHSDKKMNSGQQFEEDQYFLISLFFIKFARNQP